MATIEPIQPFIEPVRKSITVARSPQQAFQLFTSDIASWWPSRQFSVSLERTRDVVFEPRVGGLLYEIRDDNERFPWGEVLVWDEPSRLIFTWYPGRAPDSAQEVEVTFTPEGNGTRVSLEHRNWQNFGSGAGAMRDQYQGGWDMVFCQCFGQACGADTSAAD